MLLIGLPGGILWLGGMVSFLCACWNFRELLEIHWLGALISLGGSVLAAAIGFAMIAAAEMLNGAKRYQIPRAKLPAYLGLELLEGLLAVGLVAVALAMMTSIGVKRTMVVVLWASCEAVIAFLLVANHRALRSKGRTWREELTSSLTSRS